MYLGERKKLFFPFSFFSEHEISGIRRRRRKKRSAREQTIFETVFSKKNLLRSRLHTLKSMSACTADKVFTDDVVEGGGIVCVRTSGKNEEIIKTVLEAMEEGRLTCSTTTMTTSKGRSGEERRKKRYLIQSDQIRRTTKCRVTFEAKQKQRATFFFFCHLIWHPLPSIARSHLYAA